MGRWVGVYVCGCKYVGVCVYVGEWGVFGGVWMCGRACVKRVCS